MATVTMRPWLSVLVLLTPSCVPAPKANSSAGPSRTVQSASVHREPPTERTASGAPQRESREPPRPARQGTNGTPAPLAASERNPLPAPVAQPSGRPAPLILPLPTPTDPLTAALEQWKQPNNPENGPFDSLLRTWEALSVSLPAIGVSGRELWLDVSYYPCCASNGNTVVQLQTLSETQNPANNATLWVLFRHDTIGNELTSPATSRRSMQAMLSRMGQSRPRALSVLVPHEMDRHSLDVRWGNRGLWLDESQPEQLELREDNRTVKVRKLPTLERPSGYCCGTDNPKAACPLIAAIQAIWLDQPTGLIVIQVGDNGGPDGCEVEPRRLIVPWPTKTAEVP